MNTTQTTAPRTCRYSVSQRVEVEAYDFTKRDYPLVWLSATVTQIEARDDGLWDVMVEADNGQRHPQIVGKRGGSRKVRAL